MNAARTGLAIATPLALTAVLSTGSSTPSETRPIDRWLVSEPLAAETDAKQPLLTDLLDAPGEPGVLPDRGLPAAGVTWSLLRRDGEASVPLDSLLPERSPGTVVYAHAYIRLPADRTLRLAWAGEDCTAARAWLNGREVAASPVRARFGAGWNTLLLKLVAGDCPFGYAASLASIEPTSDTGLVGVRVQASRPPGDVRTGPDDWVAVADTAHMGADRRWKGDRLYAGLVVGLTGWGRAPIADVEVELRSAPGGRAIASWLVPGTAGDVVIPVRLDRLAGLLDAGVADVRVAWGEAERDRRLQIAGATPGSTDRVALEGWGVKQSGSRSGARSDGLPNASGWILEGEWKVPEALAGRRLALDVTDSPGEYALNGSPAPVADGSVALCTPCARGARLGLRATSTAAWTALPAVRIRDSDPER